MQRKFLKKLDRSDASSKVIQKQRELTQELNDHIEHIAKDFCSWVRNIEGEDESCNLSEEHILKLFAVGHDSDDMLDLEDDRTIRLKNKKIEKLGTCKTVKCNKSTKLRPFHEEFADIEEKRTELEAKLNSMPSISLLKDFKCRKLQGHMT